MSFPAISPCAIAPIINAAYRRRANSPRPSHGLENYSDHRVYSEHDVVAGGDYRRQLTNSMLELQPIKPGYNQSDPPAGTLCDVKAVKESNSRQNQSSCESVRNYDQLVQSSPPVIDNDSIMTEQNGNNENWQYYTSRNVYAMGHHGEANIFNSCKSGVGRSHLCNALLSRIVSDDSEQGDLIPTIFSTNETGFGEMTEADQDINVSVGLGRRNEGELLERGCCFGERLYINEEDISLLNSCKISSGAYEQSEIQPAQGIVFSRSSSDMSTNSSTAGCSAEVSPPKLSDTDCQPQMVRPDGLVEIGRCSIYMDTQSGEYHSVVYGSFPIDGNSILHTLKEETSRHSSTLASNQDLGILNTEQVGSCSLSKMAPDDLSSHRNRASKTNSYGCVCLKGNGVDASVDAFRERSEFEQGFKGHVSDHVATSGQFEQGFKGHVSDHVTTSGQFEQGFKGNVSDHVTTSGQFEQGFKGYVSDHVTTSGHLLSAPGHQSPGHSSDSEQLAHTYPGTVACKSEVRIRQHGHDPTHECRDVKNLSTLAHCDDMPGAVCPGCCVHLSSNFVSSDHPTIIHANNSPTYFPLAASHTSISDHTNDTKEDWNPHESKQLDTEELCSQVKGNKEEHFSQCFSKENKPISALSSMLGDMSGRTTDKSHSTNYTFDRHTEDEHNVCRSDSPQGLTSVPDNGDCIGGRDLTDHIAAECSTQLSPQESNQEGCLRTSSLSGSDNQTNKRSMVKQEDRVDESPEAKKQQLRRFRELTRNYAAYLCCPPDALITFGLPFHQLLESWGFSIFIPERNLPVTGSKYANIAECVEERCNGKVIVILSNTYADSDECLFLTNFAKTLDPDSRHRNIIPVLIDAGVEVPSILRGLSLIKYNYLFRSGWLKEKLVKAIAA